jgi:DNA-binding transcriptional regulator GbsR (MarR family)
MESATLTTRSWLSERRRFVEAGGNTTHSFGLGRMIGRAYALLYLTPEPMALEDIALSLSVSKASASIVVRQLSSWHALRQVWIPGDRRDYYETETNFSIILKEGIMPGLRKKLQSAGMQIERSMSAESGAVSLDCSRTSEDDRIFTREQRAELRRRLKTAQSLHRRADRVLTSKLLSRFL